MIKVKLSDLANIKMGQSPQGETCNENGDGIPLLNGPSEFTSFYPIPKQYTNDPKKVCQEFDILFCVRGSTTGRMNWADKKYAIGRGLASISHKKGKEFNHFLKYLIEYNLNSILNLTSGSTFPNLTNDNLASYEFYVPETEVQKKTSIFLSNIDSKIEINNRINSELEAMAKTLYHYWFVQFDFPNEEGKPYKSSGGKMVWNEELKREIPEGWEIGTISDISEFIRGVSYDKKSIKTSNDSNVIPILRATNITGNQIDLNDMVYVPSELVNKKQILNKFDILITMSSGSIEHIGKNGFYYFDETVSFGAFCAKFVPKQYYHFYLFNYTQSDFMSNTIKNECLGTNINNLNSGMVNGFKLVIPAEDILKLFNEKVESIYKKISINYKENQELASLRDWLLPMLMNGQVSVASTSSAKENYKVEDTILGMVAEPAEELKSKNKKQAKVISLKPSNVDIYKRTLLAAEIVYQLHDEATLGHLKLQKLLYLCQEINNMSLPMNFLKQAMGPYDNRLMRSLDKQLEEKRWFKFEKTEFLKYKPLGAVGSHQNDYQKYFEADKPKIDYLIATFRKYKSQDIEAVATLYACWKEALENKELINLELILKKFYSWSKEKEKFNPDDLKRHLNWMKNNGIYPR
ncbi:restriction endonuclease subunit S [Flavobacterium sp.]|uniref:restriction endonuclease subunit S n=1 Tax=Flavobacterium sp. TaxID=239 RepID=UPI002FDEA68A